MGGGPGLGIYGGTGGGSKRTQLLSSVSNSKLHNAIDQVYRPKAIVGDGGLADAIRYEKETGQKVGGCSHVQKGKERLKNLENIRDKENLNDKDKKTVEGLIDDLKNALGVS